MWTLRAQSSQNAFVTWNDRLWHAGGHDLGSTSPTAAIPSGFRLIQISGIIWHGHQITRVDLRQFDPGVARTRGSCPQGSRPPRLRGVESADARLQGAGATIADAR